MQKNQTIKAQVTDLSYQAMGVAHYHGMTVFINYALPGEVVSAKIIKVKKRFAFAKIEKIIKKSPNRVEVKLNQWLQTGLAPLAHLKYDQQLLFKREQVVNLLHKAGLDDVKVGSTLPSPEQTGYRNKAQVPVRRIKGRLEIGFFRRHSHDLVPLTNFFTTDPEMDRVLVDVRNFLRKFKVPAYDEVHNRGEVRYLDVRRSKASGEIMVILVARHKNFAHLPQLADKIAGLKGVSSVMLNYNPKKTNVILGKTSYLLKGKPYIMDRIGRIKFRISPTSFFQINSLQTPRLYQLAIKKAELKPSDLVIDAYSGIGTIGLTVASRVKAVRGMEVVADAVRDANANAKINGISNAKYVTGKAEKVMPRWASQGVKADVIFVDPPRKGLTPEFINAAAASKPKKVVYISCNPATMIRDLQLFGQKGFTFSEIDPVDMFPQTPHIEAVTVLKRTKK